MSSEENIEQYQSYGLQAVKFVGYACVEEHTLHDISTDRAVVEEMARLFNERRLEPSRLAEVVQSML